MKLGGEVTCPAISREELKLMLKLTDDELDAAIARLKELGLIKLCDCIPPQWLTAEVLVLW